MVTTVMRGTLASSTPTKIIPTRREPVLGRRRRDDGGSPTSDQSSPKKFKTVVFGETINNVKHIGTKTLDEVKREMCRALDDFAAGSDERKHETLAQIFIADGKGNDDDSEGRNTRELLLHVLALRSCAPILVKCTPLVKATLRCAWLGRDDNFVKAYVEYLASLAFCGRLNLVLEMLVDKFTQPGPLSIVPTGYPFVEKDQMNKRLHVGLEYLLKLFPDAQRMLLGLINSNFPYPEAPAEQHIEYVDHLLAVKEYAPDVGRDILETILTKAVKLDVEMQLDLEDTTDDLVKEVLESLNNSQRVEEDDEFDGEDNGADDGESVVDIDEEQNHLAQIKSKIQTMDAILDRLFQYYSRRLEDPDSEEAADCFEDIMADFVNIILTRVKSRHSQFIAFWAAQKSPEFVDRFVGILVDIARDSSRPALIRNTSVCYLGGFVARGAKLSAAQVQMVITCLLDYISVYRFSYEPNCRGPDVRKYPIYYSFFQSVLYIFCFRFQDLVVGGSSLLDREDMSSYMTADLVWMDGLQVRLQESIHSRLNPLKVCSPAIVQEFARLSAKLRFLYVYSRLEQNKSVSLASTISNVYSNGGALREDAAVTQDEEKRGQMEMYYPFDPYQLPVSSRWLQEGGLYKTWETIPDPSSYEVTEEEEDDSEPEGEDQEDVNVEDSESG